MVYFPKDELKEGMVLAKPLFTQDGDLLLAKGEALSHQYIKRLIEIGYSGIYIEVDGTEEVNPSNFLSDEQETAVRTNVKNLQTDIQKTVKEAEKQLEKEQASSDSQAKQFIFDEMGNLKNGEGIFGDLDIAGRVSESVSLIVENVLLNKDGMSQVSNLRDMSEFYFKHAIDTTILSVLLGIEFGFNKKEIEVLASGALLHNIGMTLLPKELVNRDDRLSYKEHEQIKKHPEYGFDILRAARRYSLLSAHVAYQHHERQDGGGFPRAMFGNNAAPHSGKDHQKGEIHQYAEIVTVVAEYVDMITEKEHRKRRTPTEAMGILLKYAGKIYNKAIVDKFISIMPVYPEGAFFRIVKTKSTNILGFYGVVAKNDKKDLKRPEVIIMANKSGLKLKKPVKVDLAERKDIIIKIQV